MKKMFRLYCLLFWFLIPFHGSLSQTASKSGGYDTSKLDSINFQTATQRKAGVPMVTVLTPKSSSRFYDSFPFTARVGADFKRVFLFPAGFGLDTAFLGGSYGHPRGGDEVHDLVQGTLDMINRPYNTTGARSMAEESPLIDILQEELTMAMTGSKSFQVLLPATGPMSSDLAGIEAEKKIGQKRSLKPTDNMPTADYFIGSSIGIKGIELKQSSFQGGRLADFLNSIFYGNSPTQIRRILGIVSGLNFQKNDTYLGVVVNFYVSNSRVVLAASHGISITRIRSEKGIDVSGINRSSLKSDSLHEAIRSAVQDALNNLSILAP